MSSAYDNSRLSEITDTVKELRVYGSDEARAQRGIAHEKFTLEGISRKRAPIPWAIAQLRLAAALILISVQSSDIPGLRRSAYRLEKARRIFKNAGHEETAQKCVTFLAIIKKKLAELGDEDDLFDPFGKPLLDAHLEPEGQRYANDLADRLRDGAESIDRDAARRKIAALRQSREAEELEIRNAGIEREQEKQERESVIYRQRDDDRGIDR